MEIIFKDNLQICFMSNNQIMVKKYTILRNRSDKKIFVFN